MRPGALGDIQRGTHHTTCSLSFVSPQVPIASNHGLSLLVHHSSLHHNSLGSIHIKLLSCWVESTHPFAARVVDRRPSVLLHPSGDYNCYTRCRLQMFLKPQVCVKYGNRTREHQSGHQSSYWLWTSVPNFSYLTKTGVTHSPPHPTKTSKSYINIFIGSAAST